MKTTIILTAIALISSACGGSIDQSTKDEGCKPYAYAPGQHPPLYPCDDDPAHPHAGPQYEPKVITTDGVWTMTCVCR